MKLRRIRPHLATAAASVALAILLAPAALAQDEGGAAAGQSIRSIYEALAKVELDGAKSVRVENLQVGRDVMDITLKSGRLFFAKPWKAGEKPTAAIFEGEGHAKFVPVNKLEKHQFKKAYEGKEELDEDFQHAFIRFNDDLYDTLKDQLQPDRAGEEISSLFRERQEALDDLLFNTEIPIIEDILSPVKRNQMRLVEFDVDKKKWVSYFYNPESVEENTLFTHKRVGFDAFQQSSLLSVWHDKQDYERGGDLEKEDKDRFEIQHYDADFTVLKDGLVLDGNVRIDLAPIVERLATVTFSFITYYDFAAKEKEFKIRSVTTPDGTPLEYIHDNYQLLVQLDKIAKQGEQKSIVVSYTADFIRPNVVLGPVPPGAQLPPQFDALDSDAQTFSLLNTFPWFPQYGFLKRYTFDWRIKVPKPFIAVGSGTTVKRWEEGGYNCLHAVEEEKVALASWLFGKYQLYTDEEDEARPRIYVASLPKQYKQREWLYNESRQIINWYEQWANPFPYDELVIAQMGFFYGFGQAPPGLVQLTGETFLSAGEINDIFGGNSRFKYTFLAHEIGHEWFGHVVSWASYHDQWLSESYTEYMSGLYAANRLDEKAFMNELRAWKERAELVPDGGSIWLGQRNARHYVNVTYNKGPFVLHMLRLTMQAQFGAQKGDDLFFAAMKAFLDGHRHQNATTTDFINVVNQTTKSDYSAFFQQWFRDIGIPEVVFSYNVRPTEDGKYVVSMKAVQSDEDNLKQILLPVDIHFGDNVVTRFMPLTKPESTYQIKVPSNPDKVEANANNGALVRLKIEKG
jgi:hypothetical protein